MPSPKVQIQIRGQEKLARLARNSAQTAREMGDTIDRVLLSAGSISERGIKLALTTGPTRAILTGYLRSSVRINQFKSRSSIQIGPNTNYAVFIHEGTKYMRARPFIPAGVEQQKQAFADLMKRTGVTIGVKITNGL